MATDWDEQVAQLDRGIGYAVTQVKVASQGEGDEALKWATAALRLMEAKATLMGLCP